MKELSIEEKAKRYDEALKYAMIYYKNGDEDMKMMMKTCFPVLVEESEDERIRKELIEYFRWNVKQILNDFSNKECIAWLEKQGEQKPADKVEPKFKVGDTVRAKTMNHFTFTIKDITDKQYVDTNGGKFDIEGQDYLELVEQKPADMNIKKKELANSAKTCKDEDIRQFLIQEVEETSDEIMSYRNMNKKDVLDWLEKQGQVKESSISQHENKTCKENDDSLTSENERTWIINYLSNRELNSSIIAEKENIKKAIAWLEKQGEQTPAWSEDDEYYRNIILYILNNECVGKTDKENAINWLKSLKERCTWKPSDEQMKGIECTIKTLKYQLNTGDKRLNSLYNDLKKLKE